MPTRFQKARSKDPRLIRQVENTKDSHLRTVIANNPHTPTDVWVRHKRFATVDGLKARCRVARCEDEIRQLAYHVTAHQMWDCVPAFQDNPLTPSDVVRHLHTKFRLIWLGNFKNAPSDLLVAYTTAFEHPNYPIETIAEFAMQGNERALREVEHRGVRLGSEDVHHVHPIRRRFAHVVIRVG